MAITAEFSDADEPVADTDAELATNQHLYGVISGCAVTYDAANMTYDIAAGTILHNGLVVTVAAQANANTLVADSTNPRWTLISVDSTGTQVMTSGTAAATPSKPELGDNVWLAAVKIEAGQTIANNIAVKLDKRVMTHAPHSAAYKYKTAAQNFTTATLVDVTATSGNIAFEVAASTAYRIEIDGYMTAVGTAGSGGFKWAFTFPAAPTIARATGYWNHVGTDTASVTPAMLSGNIAPFTDIISGTAFGGVNASNTGVTNGLAAGPFKLVFFLLNGTTAGTVTLQAAQNTAAGTSSLREILATLTPMRAE